VGEALLEWVSQLPGVAVYAVLIALSALENVFPPVPADIAVVLGAFLGRQGIVSAPLLGLLCWMANTASSAGMYFYARTHGRRFFATGWRRKLMPPEAIAVLEKAYGRHGVYGIFFSRFLPGVRAAVTPFAGVVGMDPVKALLPAASASLIWYALLVVVGTALGLTWDSARKTVEDATRILAWIAGAATLAAVFWLWRRARA
jgi:membrane protein DedA with SNARE-associated domain